MDTSTSWHMIQLDDYYVQCELTYTDAVQDLLSGIKLLASDANRIWQTSLSPDIIHQQSLLVNVVPSYQQKKYCLETRAAFAGAKDFEFEVTPDKNAIEIVWKKRIDDNGLKYIYGRARLEPAADKAAGMKQMFHNYQQQVQAAQQRATEMQAELRKTTELRDKAVQNYDRVVQEKQQQNEKLFEQFACVLNAKKREIVRLRESDAPTKAAAAKDGSQVAAAAAEAADGSDGYDTDEEKSHVNLKCQATSSSKSNPSEVDLFAAPDDLLPATAVQPRGRGLPSRGRATKKAVRQLPAKADPPQSSKSTRSAVASSDRDEHRAASPVFNTSTPLATVADTVPLDDTLPPTVPIQLDESVDLTTSPAAVVADECYVPPRRKKARGGAQPKPPPLPSRRSSRSSHNSSGQNDTVDRLT